MKKYSVVTIVFILSMLLAACAPAAAPTKAAAPANSAAAAKPTVDAAKKPAVAPPAGSTAVSDADKAAYEAVAKTVADSAGMTNYTWEAYQLPAGTTWDAVFQEYHDQLSKAGWAGKGSVTDITNGKVGVFADAEGYMFILAYVDNGGKVESLALFGN